jgi:hypothetical protein
MRKLVVSIAIAATALAGLAATASAASAEEKPAPIGEPANPYTSGCEMVNQCRG